ncbi:hypothetical protein [Sphingobacterium sp. 18053]|uniref:hypothetical protein n=1 Tax=Sphingobacterium sp. 18053 TaxID=2681401 RepID=UPI00135B6E36|nr:hypothetical protein [Sphingobacterium sp. 18053]
METPLITLLTDRKTQQYTLSKRPVGWCIDCLGDLGSFDDNWSHMYDYYPQGIVGFGMQDAWRKAPKSLAVCWVMQKWKNEGPGKSSYCHRRANYRWMVSDG